MTKHAAPGPVDPLTMQEVILRLQVFWADQGCSVFQPVNTEVGAGTANPATALRVLGPEPWRAAYVEPSVRPDDSRYGDNPNRLQTHTQFQVILKPDPGDPQELYLASLAAIGIDVGAHDVRFVEDNWASPALGAWGLGWEVWLDGLEITQFTYFQQAGGLALDPVSVEITYGLERIMMSLQNVSHFTQIRFSDDLSYGEVFAQSEYEMSRYYLDDADLALNRSLFDQYAAEAARLIELGLPVPAYTYVLKCSHTFNVLDARGAVSTTDRAHAFAQMRGLTRRVAQLWSRKRAELGHPLGVWTPAGPARARPLPAVDGTRTLLFEIGVEELPAAEVARVAESVAAAARTKLAATRLGYGEITVRSTPRRIVLTVAGLAPREKASSRTVRGPRVSAARDADGAPTRALTGFLRGQGATEVDLGAVVHNGIEHVAVERTEESRPAAEVVAPLLGELVTELRGPKNIRWSDPRLSFSRPVRWLLALLGDTPLPVDASLLRSGTTTQLLRAQVPPAAEVARADGYAAFLAGHDIVLDRPVRRRLVVDQAGALAATVGGVVDTTAEAALVDEITDLVESPNGILGSFDERYLELPAAILTTVMRGHQRYLPVLVDGVLSNHFVVIANGACDPDAVRTGNETVVRARFEDASFFWRADLKVAPAQFRRRLDALLFEERLGSVAQRADRIESLAATLADVGAIGTAQQDTVTRAGAIAKFDLASQLVVEFSGLAGVMAREFALRAGEPEPVATALLELEMPRSAGQPLPATVPGAVLSLADRFDFLTAMLAIGANPTGSSDPLGVRRAAGGVVSVLRAFPALDGISVRTGIRAAAVLLADQGVAVAADLVDRAVAFTARRYEKQILDEGTDATAARAVLALADRPPRADRTLRTLEALAGSPGWSELVAALQRVLRILPAERPHGSTDTLTLPAERDLAAAVRELADCDGAADGELAAFVAAATAADLAGRVNAFFTDVMVMDPDPAVRAARLGLLADLAAQATAVLDWQAL